MKKLFIGGHNHALVVNGEECN